MLIRKHMSIKLHNMQFIRNVSQDIKECQVNGDTKLVPKLTEISFSIANI